MIDDKIESFPQIIADFERNIANLPEGIEIPNSTWIYEALAISKDITNYITKNGLDDISKTYDPLLIYKFKVSISQIGDLNKIFQMKNLLTPDSYKNYVKKINIVLNSKVTPLIPNEEDHHSNEGRNTLFELRLLNKFIKAGYQGEFPMIDHPDFKIITKKRTYSVECKRLYSSKSFRKNITKAIGQLIEYSLEKDNELGIVAINISRYFDLKHIIVVDEACAKEKIRELYVDFIKETLPKFKTISFPIKIPIIIFEYSEIGMVGGQLKSIAFTDINDTQVYSNGISLYKIIEPDFIPLKKVFGSVFNE